MSVWRPSVMRLGGRNHMSVFVVTAILAGFGVVGAVPASAVVSGDNGLIAFTTDRDGNREVYAMNPDGSNPVNLTRHPSDDYSASWSPDGRRIAFVSDRNGLDEIFLMGADGSGQQRLTQGAYPTWSPDGDLIAFSYKGDIYVVSPDGSGLRRLTDSHLVPRPVGITSVSDSKPSWSPDGSKLVFVRGYMATPTGSSAELRLVDMSTPTNTQFIAAAGWDADRPDHSPDGSSIVFAEVGVHLLSSQVYVMSADGAGLQAIPIPAGFTHAGDPAWSPDGNLIVLTAFTVNSVPHEIISFPADGTGPATNLTNNPAFDTEPAWQPLNPYPVGMFDPASGIWHLRGESGVTSSFYFGNPGDVPIVGDWDCDGRDSPGLYRRADGYVYLRNSNTQGIADTAFYFGNPGDIPLAGDFDGDGCDTVSLYRPSEQAFYIVDSLGTGGGGLGAADYSFMFGDPGDKPFTGDFDGDGRDEVALHRETTGRVYLRYALTSGVADLDFIFGVPGDAVVSSDWNGDGADTPALFRPANRTFYFRFSNTTGIADAHYIFGDRRWIPVAGDFDLD